MSTIKVRGLRKEYGVTEALRGISFQIGKGEIVGFLGPNGAGKTTTMKILTCYMSASGGEAMVSGYDCSKDPLLVRRKIGYLPENNPLYTEMTVGEYLRFMSRLHGVDENNIDERIEAVTADCGLVERVNYGIGTLSKGYRQRVGLAASLLHDPEILILDEPTAGLDPNQIVEIRNLIKTLGKSKTVILCSHNLNEVELTCTRVLIISKGKIVATGTPADLKGMVEGHANIRATVRGEKNEILMLLRSIDGVREVIPFSVREKGAFGFDLVTVKNRDLREKIVEAILANEFKLLEIHRETVSLEAIFNQFTTSKTLI